MDFTFRQILKWGDKREDEVNPLMVRIIRDKFGLNDSDFKMKFLSGAEQVKLEKPSALKPRQLEFPQGHCRK